MEKNQLVLKKEIPQEEPAGSCGIACMVIFVLVGLTVGFLLLAGHNFVGF